MKNLKLRSFVEGKGKREKERVKSEKGKAKREKSR